MAIYLWLIIPLLIMYFAGMAAEDGDDWLSGLMIVVAAIVIFVIVILIHETLYNTITTSDIPVVETVVSTKIVDGQPVSDTTYVYHFNN